MEARVTNGIRDSRDWALRLLVRRQRLRLELGHARRARRARPAAAKRNDGPQPPTSALAGLAALAERLCARSAALGQR